MAKFDPVTNEFYCECGCGTVILPWKRFVYHHYSGSAEGQESARKVGEANLGLVRSDEFCQTVKDYWSTHPERRLTQNNVPGNLANLGKFRTPEQCQNISDGILEALEGDPTIQERESEAKLKNNPYGYGYGWSAIRDLVVCRDNWTCQGCGSKSTLYVHHIDGNKLNADEFNLITVCASCNTFASRREVEEYWYVFYSKKIVEIYTSRKSTMLGKALSEENLVVLERLGTVNDI